MTWRDPPKLQSTHDARISHKITPEDLAKSGSEDGHQSAVFCWAAMNVAKYPDLRWLHAIPNGGQRHIATATKLVATGSRSGVWDIFLPCPIQTEWAKHYAGLYIDMKKADKRNHKNGGLSDEQVEFGVYADKMGYCIMVCYSWEEARDILIRYMECKV